MSIELIPPAQPIKAEILVVDDAPVNLRILSQVLSEQGYRVRLASSGSMALETISASLPDLILLDIMMPDLDGYEVCRKIKADPKAGDVPVIFLTALDQMDNKIKGFEAGGVDYITKPFQFPEVLARVSTHLILRRLQCQLEDSNKELEERVVERTAELVEVNRQLQSEINERLKIEQALRESEERYALAIQGSNDGLWDWDLLIDTIYLSPRWKSILGFMPEEIGDTPDEWFNRVHPDDLARFRMSIFNHVENISPHLEEEYRMLHRDGTYRYVLTRGLAVRNAEGKAYRMAGSQSDTTYRRRIEEQLRHDAYYDSLTALPNRALFLERVENALNLAKAREDYGFAVLTLDIDRFKNINEEMGHEMGDLLLAEVSWKLKSIMRPIDTVARVGEDEFGVLLENIKSVREVERAIDHVRVAVKEPLDLGGQGVVISLRIGAALYLPGSVRSEKEETIETYESTDQLLRDASLAVELARKSSNNRCIIQTPAERPS